MPAYEYKVVPAPTKGQKAKGVKTPEDRFSLAVQELMNEMAFEGWEYQRAETLPSVERSGLTGSKTEYRNMLVFRRLRDGDNGSLAPRPLPSLSRKTEVAAEPAPTRPEPAVTRPVAEEEPAPAPTRGKEPPVTAAIQKLTESVNRAKSEG